jgi:hypothetical protein
VYSWSAVCAVVSIRKKKKMNNPQSTMGDVKSAVKLDHGSDIRA